MSFLLISLLSYLNTQESQFPYTVMKTAANKELWWISRIYSGLLVLFSVSMFASYRFFPETAGMPPGKPEPLSAEAILGLSIAGLGLLGLLIAWRWELLGGIFALVAFFVLAIMEPMLFQAPVAYFYPGCAVVFILLWVKNRNLL